MDVVWSDPQEDQEDYLEALEELEDVWMRNPSREQQQAVAVMTNLMDAGLISFMVH